MFESKYKRKYDQLVYGIKAEIFLNYRIIKFYEENKEKLEERGENTSALMADKLCRQEFVYILNQILKRSEEA